MTDTTTVYPGKFAIANFEIYTVIRDDGYLHGPLFIAPKTLVLVIGVLMDCIFHCSGRPVCVLTPTGMVGYVREKDLRTAEESL